MATDLEETKNTLLDGIKKSSTKAKKSKKITQSDKAVHLESQKLPKWKTLEKVTVLLTSEQKDGMDELARKLMRFRAHGDLSKDERERITANTIFRALLDNFITKSNSLDLEAIQNEDELKEWISRLFK